MTLLKFKFTYKKYVTVNKETGVETTQYYPIIPCSFNWNGKQTKLVDGLLDSGSDTIVLPLGLAKFLELDLILEEEPMRVVGAEVKRYISKVNLTIGRGGREVPLSNLKVSIPEKGKTPIIIGRKPVFELYEVTFIEAERTLIMMPYKKQKKK